MDSFGAALAGIDDIDGDGVADVLVGAPGSTVSGTAAAGAIFAFSGSTGALLYRIDGGNGDGVTGDALGQSIAVIGDIDLDGTDDFAVGAPFALDSQGTQTGIVLIISGRTAAQLARLEGTSTNGEFGSCLTILGDINGNASNDLLIGAPVGAANGEGEVTIYDPISWLPIRTIVGEQPSSGFGSAAVSVGDIDNDGLDDIAIGAPSVYSPFGTPKALVYSGGAGTKIREFTGPVRSRFGASLASADFDGDGVVDLLVGVPREDTASVPEAGEVVLYSALAEPPAFRAAGVSGGEEFGRVLVRLDDLNGDGRNEFLIGSPGATPFAGFLAGAAYVYGFASVQNARAFYRGGGDVRVGANSSPVFLELEPASGGFSLGEITPASVTLRSTTGAFREIRPLVLDRNSLADSDGDGVPEARIGFSIDDWRRFFSGLPDGKTSVLVSVDGALTGGRRFTAPLDLMVKALAPLAVTVFPNPMRKSTTITFRISVPGRLKVELFDSRGRRCRYLWRDGVLPDGYHDLTFDGRSDRGDRLPAGVYFYRVSGTDGTSEGRFVIVR